MANHIYIYIYIAKNSALAIQADLQDPVVNTEGSVSPHEV